MFNREKRAYDKFSEVNAQHMDAFKDAIMAANDELGDDQKAVVRSMIVAEQTASPGVSSLPAGDEWLRRQVG